LARLEGQIAVLQRLPDLELDTNVPPVWRHNLGLRGLTALPVRFGTNHRSPSADQTPES
jgi:cytochrome P450